MRNATWKQAIFLGGAVLILAACDQATAPDAQLRQSQDAALAARKGAAAQSPIGQSSDCRTGYSVQIGVDSVVYASACMWR